MVPAGQPRPHGTTGARGCGAEQVDGRPGPAVASPRCAPGEPPRRPARAPSCGSPPGPRPPAAAGWALRTAASAPQGPPAAGGTHVSVHERPHQAAVHGSSGRARPRSAPPRPARRAHGPGPECGRAPPTRSRPGRAGRCGGRPRPLRAHARPGPRPLGWGGRSGPRLLAGVRAGSVEARTMCSAAPLASPLLSSALGSSSPLLGSALLPGSSPPAPALRPPPPQPCLRPPGPGAHVTARVSMRPAARGPRPATPALAHQARARPALRVPGPVPPPERGGPEDPGAEAGGRRAGTTPCCFRLPGPGLGPGRGDGAPGGRKPRPASRPPAPMLA